MTKNNVLEKVTKKQLLTPENAMYYTILHQKQYPATKRPSGTLPYIYKLLPYTTPTQYPASKKALRYITLQI